MRRRDVFDPATRSRVMASVKSRGNRTTEVAFGALLRAAGLTGWRRQAALPGTPDFAFTGVRVAVFVHGCFWHGCPKHYRAPATRRAYWKEKVDRNRRRDRRARDGLRRRGWRVVTVWECGLRDRPADIALRVTRLVQRARDDAVRGVRAATGRAGQSQRRTPPGGPGLVAFAG